MTPDEGFALLTAAFPDRYFSLEVRMVRHVFKDGTVLVKPAAQVHILPSTNGDGRVGFYGDNLESCVKASLRTARSTEDTGEYPAVNVLIAN